MAAALSPQGLAGSSALPSRHCPWAAVPVAAAPRPRGRPSCLLVAAGRRISEADMYQSVVLPQGPPTPVGQPWYVTGGLALVGLVAALRIAKAIKKSTSMSSRLEERGFKKGGVADDRAYTSAIRGMRKMQYEELSDEQIQAARRRRQREVERDMAPLDLESIELPDNHPFAVKKRLAPEEEELQRSRMSARRGLSAEDMRRLQKQQALADQMEEEQEARHAAQQRQGGL